jgi:hypothetical protein
MTEEHYENQEDDGLSSFSLDQLGQRKSAFGGAKMVKFNNGVYATREGETIGPEREQILLGLVKVIQKFVGKKLVETIIVPPREDFPDIDAMNEGAPREEWGVNLNGDAAGPYVRVLVLKLLDAKTMDCYAFVTQTTGGSIAVGDITGKVKIMRRIRGPNVTAVVSCQSATMKSNYNPRGVRRPEFKVLRWIALAASPETVTAPAPTQAIAPPAAAAPAAPVAPAAAATPAAAAAAAATAPTAVTPAAAPAAAPPVAAAPEAPPITPEPAAVPTVTVDTANIGTVVLPPTLKEELQDEVPF